MKYSYISSSSRRSKLLVFYLVALCLANAIKRALRVPHTYQGHKMQPQQAAQAAKLWMQASRCTKNSRCLRCIAFASKRKKRAAPRVCTARFFRSYKLEICYLVLFFRIYIISRPARKTRADLSFAYLHALRIRRAGCGTSAVEPNGSAAFRAAFKANK